MAPIPFIRRDPDGKRYGVDIQRAEGVELAAHNFLAKNGRYLTEVLKSGQVHFFALIDVPTEDGKGMEPANVAAVVCDNDSETGEAVDWLVQESIKYIPDAPQPKIQIPSATQVRRFSRAELKNQLFVVEKGPFTP